jgi:hypothetical protein
MTAYTWNALGITTCSLCACVIKLKDSVHLGPADRPTRTLARGATALYKEMD